MSIGIYLCVEYNFTTKLYEPGLYRCCAECYQYLGTISLFEYKKNIRNEGTNYISQFRFIKNQHDIIIYISDIMYVKNKKPMYYLYDDGKNINIIQDKLMPDLMLYGDDIKLIDTPYKIFHYIKDIFRIKHPLDMESYNSTENLVNLSELLRLVKSNIRTQQQYLTITKTYDKPFDKIMMSMTFPLLNGEYNKYEDILSDNNKLIITLDNIIHYNFEHFGNIQLHVTNNDKIYKKGEHKEYIYRAIDNSTKRIIFKKEKVEKYEFILKMFKKELGYDGSVTNMLKSLKNTYKFSDKNINKLIDNLDMNIDVNHRLEFPSIKNDIVMLIGQDSMNIMKKTLLEIYMKKNWC